MRSPAHSIFVPTTDSPGSTILRIAAILGLFLGKVSSRASADPLVEYSIGNPSPEEQLIVELANRLRTDPVGEGKRLRYTDDPDLLAAYAARNVDMAMYETEMAVLSPVPPLAVNAKLSAGASTHVLDMLNNAFQGHTGSDGSSAGDRITAQGYTWGRWSENVYAYALSPLHLHAGFVVDWGNGPGGMQDPRAHRNGLMDPNVREIGIARIVGSNGSVGPEIVDQVLASQLQSSPVYYGCRLL